MLILSSHLHLDLLSGLFPPGFHTKTLYAPHFSPYVPHATPISFLLISSKNNILLQITKLLFMLSPHSSVSSSLLGRNTFLSTLFSDTHSLRQCFSTAGLWHQLCRAARGSPGICHFSFLRNFHE